MIFCGDFRQLPPVNATPVYKGSRNHLQGALLWQSLDYFGLNQVMRQTDLVFSSILTKIGEGKQLELSEGQFIESRFRTSQWCDENLKDVRLFHRNHSADEYNKNAIQSGIEHIAEDVYSGYRNETELATARSKLHRMNTIESCCSPYSVKLSVGYPYMLTSNIDIEDGLVNGSIAKLRYIETVQTSRITSDRLSIALGLSSNLKAQVLKSESSIDQCSPQEARLIRNGHQLISEQQVSN